MCKRKPTIEDLKIWHIAVAVQYLIGGLILLLPIGFDHPSSLGLDFNHLILFGLVFAFFTLAAVFASIADKSIVGFLLAAAPFYFVSRM